MIKKIITTIVLVISIAASAYAENEMSCKVQVAVSTPPVQLDQNVAFNATNEFGFSNSITLNGGSGPQFIDKLPCISAPLTITATIYSTPSNTLFRGPSIGQCTLKAGYVILNEPNNSVSVVFPYDFNCNG